MLLLQAVCIVLNAIERTAFLQPAARIPSSLAKFKHPVATTAAEAALIA